MARVYSEWGTYFVDHRIYNIRADRNLEQFNQTVALAFQRTGYDSYYDNGYPEYFHVLAFKNSTQGLTLKFDSKELSYTCNCEFWEEEAETYHWKELDNGFLFIKLTGHEEDFTATWNGVELLDPKTTDNKR